jgi:hypothetical protein
MHVVRPRRKHDQEITTLQALATSQEEATQEEIRAWVRWGGSPSQVD